MTSMRRNSPRRVRASTASRRAAACRNFCESKRKKSLCTARVSQVSAKGTVTAFSNCTPKFRVSPLLRGVGDGVAHELTSLDAGIAQLCTAQQRAEHDRGEHVARSRIIAVDALMQADGQLSVFQTARADPSRLVVRPVSTTDAPYSS